MQIRLVNCFHRLRQINYSTFDGGIGSHNMEEAEGTNVGVIIIHHASSVFGMLQLIW